MTKEYKGTNWERQIEHAKASVRSKVEHPFLIVKRMFHAGRTRALLSVGYQRFLRKINFVNRRTI